MHGLEAHGSWSCVYGKHTESGRTVYRSLDEREQASFLGVETIQKTTNYGTTLDCGLFYEDGSRALQNDIKKKLSRIKCTRFLRVLVPWPLAICRTNILIKFLITFTATSRWFLQRN